MVRKTISHYKVIENLASLYGSFRTLYTIEEVNDHE